MSKSKVSEKKKIDKKSSKSDESIAHILSALESIDKRLTVLEESSDKVIDCIECIDDLEIRLSKIQNRMGL
tara:strand:+ start:345 stop:557 length:213 start_codon:yes stop_codon:yes gene_type:complete